MARPPLAQGPEYQFLLERVWSALNLGREAASIDFKVGSKWADLKGKLLRTILGMANLRDGGLVIVGFDPKGKLPPGVTDEQLDSFDPDTILDAARAFGSPPPEISLAYATDSAGVRYVTLEVREFATAPIVCRKQQDQLLVVGEVYVRPTTGRPRTSKVTNVDEMADLLDLAAEKRMRAFFALAQRTGLNVEVQGNPYDAELGDMARW